MKKQNLKKSANKNKFYRKEVVFEAKKEVKKQVKEAKKKEFPSIYRFITEEPLQSLIVIKRFFVLNWKMITFSAVASFFIVLTALTIIDFKKNLEEYNKRAVKYEKLAGEISYWKSVVSKYKDYRDGYFRLALLEHQLNNDAQAQEYLNKALKLDPNFEEGRKFQELLNKD